MPGFARPHRERRQPGWHPGESLLAIDFPTADGGGMPVEIEARRCRRRRRRRPGCERGWQARRKTESERGRRPASLIRRMGASGRRPGGESEAPQSSSLGGRAGGFPGTGSRRDLVADPVRTTRNQQERASKQAGPDPRYGAEVSQSARLGCVRRVEETGIGAKNRR